MGKTRRGQCPVCNFRCALRKDGTLQQHPGRVPGAPPCDGRGQVPKPADPNECPACMEHCFATPGLLEACFSVAIESSRTGEALMWEYLTAFHAAGHKEPDDG